MGGSSRDGRAPAAAATARVPAAGCSIIIPADTMALSKGTIASLLKGQKLFRVCSAITDLGQSHTQQHHPGQHLSIINVLTRLIAARKRARDWKENEYNSRVCSALAACTAVLKFCSSASILVDGKAAFIKHSKPARELILVYELMQNLTTAQSEVTSLLHACVQQRQQQQQQQQHGQQQQGQDAEQLLQLQQLAHRLLSCWNTAHWHWVGWAVNKEAAGHRISAAAFQLQPVELAAVLAQTLTADSPAQHFEIVAAVAYRFYKLPGKKEAQAVLFKQPAVLQMSLTMLLLHSYSAQQHAPPSTNASSSSAGSSSSSSSSSCSSSGYGSGCRDSSDLQGSCGSLEDSRGGGGSSNSAPTSHADGMQQQQQQQQQQLRQQWQQQQQQEQLAATTQQLCQALGISPAALPPFAAAVQQIKTHWVRACNSDAFIRVAPDQDLTGLNGALWAFCRAAQSVELSLQGLVAEERGRWSWSVGCSLQPAMCFGQLPRQQQALLLQGVWLLPQLLLQTVQLYGNGVGAFVERAAAAATLGVVCWATTGLQEAAAAATAGATAAGVPSSSNRGSPEVLTLPAAAGQVAVLLPTLLDSILQLMQQLLFRQPDGPLCQAVKSAQHPLSLQAAHHIDCKCSRRASKGASSTQPAPQTASREQQHPAHCSVALCADLDALTSLLALLQHLAKLPQAAVCGELQQAWRSRAPAIMLLLETLTRHLLPFHIVSAASGQSSSDGSDGGSNSSSDGCGLAGSGSGGSSSGSHGSSSDGCRGVDRASGLCSSSAAAELRLQLAACFVDRGGEPCLFQLLVDNAWPPSHTMLQPWQEDGLAQQVQQQHEQQQQQEQQLQRRLLALLASLLKAYQAQPPSAKAVVAVSSCIQLASGALKAALGPNAEQSLAAAPPLSAAEVADLRVAAAPWLAMLDRCFHAVACFLQNCIESAPSPTYPSEFGPVLEAMRSLVIDVAATSMSVAWLWRIVSSPDIDGRTAAGMKMSDAGAVVDAASAVVDAATQCPKLMDAVAAAEDDDNSSSTSSSSSAGKVTHPDSSVHKPLDETERAKHFAEIIVQIKSSCGLSEFVLQLRTAGKALCRFMPVSWCCNNPECVNLAGVSELELIGGRSCVCSGCKVARYCGRDCQVKHWPSHKLMCGQHMPMPTPAVADADATVLALL